ncbi:MAG: RNAse Z [Pirellulaceae bacterium]|nr:RNAse Z [Pirellulaceae bacterium]
MSPNLTISAYSTALFSTWYFVHEYGILLDCGDGVTASLMQKARKIRHVFISHADRDHVTGLLQFNQLNARRDLTIHAPRDSGSFPALAEFTRRFDPHMTGTQWNSLTPGEEIHVRDDLVVTPIENRHVATNGSDIKSLSYIVQSVHRKLKPEFVGHNGDQIAAIRKSRGVDAITDPSRVTRLIYSADTPVELDGRYDNAEILIHEATFLTRAELEPKNSKRNLHSSLDEVMEMVADSNVKMLILGHFSSRYSRQQIDDAVQRERKRCNIKCPIHVVYPGQRAELSTVQPSKC